MSVFIFETNKAGRYVDADGYVKVLDRLHPRADSKGYVCEHIKVATEALGRPLPTGSVVHHVDEDKTNNQKSNLVICQDRAYHVMLHSRLRIQKAGGHHNTEKFCIDCKSLLPRSRFGSNPRLGDGLNGICKACASARSLRYYAKHKDAVRAKARAWRLMHRDRLNNEQRGRRTAARRQS